MRHPAPCYLGKGQEMDDRRSDRLGNGKDYRKNSGKDDVKPDGKYREKNVGKFDMRYGVGSPAAQERNRAEARGKGGSGGWEFHFPVGASRIVSEWERRRASYRPDNPITAFNDPHSSALADNYLRNAEMAMEDDYGMIDGIINNGCSDRLKDGSGRGTSEQGQLSNGSGKEDSVLEKLKDGSRRDFPASEWPGDGKRAVEMPQRGRRKEGMERT